MSDTFLERLTEHRANYGPLHARPHVPDPIMGYEHRVGNIEDDGSPINFKWHFQRGLLQKRMSGLELAAFVLGHMPHILPLLSGYPRVQQEFAAMMVLLATSPKQATDRLLPWIRSVTREEEDDVIHMSLFDKTEQPVGPTYFVIA